MLALRAELAQTLLERGDLAQQRADARDGIHARFRHGAVCHAAAHGHARPHHAALLEAQLVLLGLADDRRVELAPDRGGAQVARADHVAFLVDERADDEPAPQVRAAPLERGGCDHRRRQAGFHIGGAAAIDAAVDQVGVERRVCPLGGIPLRHDVGVALEEQALARPLLAEHGEDVRPSGRHLVSFDVEAFPGEPAVDVVRDRSFGGGGIARANDAGNADEVTRECDDLVRVDAGEDVLHRDVHRLGAGATRAETTG